MKDGKQRSKRTHDQLSVAIVETELQLVENRVPTEKIETNAKFFGKPNCRGQLKFCDA
jgi:hypothetical protein